MTLTRTLGRSGIEISALGMGCWAIGDPFWDDETPLGWDEVHAALDLGVNFFGTANVYLRRRSQRTGPGALRFGVLMPEQILGR